MKKHLFITSLVFILLSCKTAYIKPEAMIKRTQTHKLIAILPICATLSDYKKLKDSTRIKIDDSYWVQHGIVSYLELMKPEWGLTVDFQTIAITQQLLRDANISLDSLQKMNKIELIELLEVDAVMYAEGYVEQIGIRSWVVDSFLDALVAALIGGRPSYRNSDSDKSLAKITLIDKKGSFWRGEKFIKDRITKDNQKKMFLNAYFVAIEEFPYRNK